MITRHKNFNFNRSFEVLDSIEKYVFIAQSRCHGLLSIEPSRSHSDTPHSAE